MGYKHHDTPTKSRLQGALAFARFQKQHYGLHYFNNDVFRAAGVSKS
jgi:hypothetical protein